MRLPEQRRRRENHRIVAKSAPARANREATQADRKKKNTSDEKKRADNLRAETTFDPERDS
jgi:hypothetical protein